MMNLQQILRCLMNGRSGGSLEDRRFHHGRREESAAAAAAAAVSGLSLRSTAEEPPGLRVSAEGKHKRHRQAAERQK